MKPEIDDGINMAVALAIFCAALIAFLTLVMIYG